MSQVGLRKSRSGNLTSSPPIYRIARCVVRKVDAFHKEVCETLRTVAARVKGRHDHEEYRSYEPDRQSDQQQNDQPDNTP